MDNKTALEIIKTTVLSLLPGSRVMLFGSRARGDFNKDSDYDVLVITKENFAPRERFNWMSDLNYNLVKALKAPVDVLVNSEEEITKKIKLPGHVIRWAMKEGIEL